MESTVRLHIKLLVKGTNKPLTGEEYTVKLYDKDFLKADYLGKSSLDDFGHAIIPVTSSDFSGRVLPVEKYPDIFFTIQNKERIFYKSTTFKNLHLEEAMDFPSSGAIHYDLGTFIIEI